MTYGLNNLDNLLEKYLNFKNGFFVEAGANNGIHQSNTLLFEEMYNWKGLLIEPNFKNYERCKINRPNCFVEHCALVSKNYNKNYIEGNFEELENFNGESLMQGVTEIHLKKTSIPTKVPAKTFNFFIEKYNIKNIDLFSLDVEGYELEVLDGLNFAKVAPKYFLIETGPDDNRIKSIIDYMQDKNYTAIDRLSINDFLFKLNS